MKIRTGDVHEEVVEHAGDAFEGVGLEPCRGGVPGREADDVQHAARHGQVCLDVLDCAGIQDIYVYVFCYYCSLCACTT